MILWRKIPLNLCINLILNDFRQFGFTFVKRNNYLGVYRYVKN